MYALNHHQTSVPGLLALLVLVSSSAAQTRENSDVCEYDIDLKKNTFHARCQGQPLGVNVYANNARVMNPGQQHGDRPPGGGVGGVGGAASMNPACFWGTVPLPDSETYPEAPGSQSMNSTATLEAMRTKLHEHKSAITNISSLLSRGDNDLRSDLQALRGLASGDAAVRESIIATMRNQYNFMRTAILAHNAELNQVFGLLDSLVTVTSQWLQSTRQAHLSLQHQLQRLNRTVTNVKSSSRSGRKKVKKDKKESTGKEKCPLVVSAIGRGESIQAPWDKGVVMSDAAHLSNRIWIMAVSESSAERDQLLQYDNPREDIESGLVSRRFSLPFFCEGTGHVVFRNALFCQKAGGRVLAKYNLKRMAVAAELTLPNAGIDNTFPYQFGLKSDIDLAVDEMGLWVIYSTEESAGKIVISKVSARNLELEKTWLTSFPKRLVGNSFMVCGVLYATNSFQDIPTFIRYTYDTNTQEEAIHDNGNVIFNNAVDFNASQQATSVMLDYNPKKQRLFSWSNAQIQTFRVYLEEPSV